MARTYVPIATTTLGSTTTSYTFSSIPQTYTDLVISADAIAPNSGGRNIIVRFNSDSAGNYSQTYLWGGGNNGYGSGKNTNLTYVQAGYYGYFDSTHRAVASINISDYTSTNKYKTLLNRTSSYAGADIVVGTWRSTAAITSVTLLTNSGDFGSGSTFTLYGIKAA